MEYKIYSIPYTAHCVTCGSEEIAAVCHQCGRPICQSHINMKPAQDPQFSFFRRITKDFICNQEIPEFYQLKIPNRPKKGYFFDPGTLRIDIIKDGFHYILEWVNYLWEVLHIRFSLNILGKPITKRNQHDSTAHCEQCIHYATSFYPLVQTGIFITFITLLLTLFGLFIVKRIPLFPISYAFIVTWIGCLIGVGIGCCLFIIGVSLNLLFFLEDQKRNVPDNNQVDCDLIKLKVVERIFGEIKLQKILNEAWRYTSDVILLHPNSISGDIQAAFLFNDKSCYDAQMFQNRASLLGKESRADKVQIGSILLNGVWWRLNESPEDVKKYGEWASNFRNNSCLQILLPKSQLNVENNFNSSREGVTTILTKRIFNYPPEIGVIQKVELPAQMIISFSREIERRAIDIEVEILDKLMPQMEGACIYALDVEIPHELGQVAVVDPLGIIETTWSAEYSRISWQNLFFDTNTKANCYRKNIFIQFREDLPNLSVLPDSACLKGHIELHYPGLSIREAAYKSVTYTGRSYKEPLNNAAVMIFDAFGKRRDSEVISEFETHIKANYQLDLRGLRLEQTFRDSPPPFTKTGVSPNNLVIANIIDKLNSQKIFYIKRVIENPPPISKENANKVQHYWDLHGRYYEGVFPIDFHIIFTGEEVCNDQSQCTFQAEINTEAVVTNEDMEKKVKNTSERLRELIQDAL